MYTAKYTFVSRMDDRSAVEHGQKTVLQANFNFWGETSPSERYEVSGRMVLNRSDSPLIIYLREKWGLTYSISQTYSLCDATSRRADFSEGLDPPSRCDKKVYIKRPLFLRLVLLSFLFSQLRFQTLL